MSEPTRVHQSGIETAPLYPHIRVEPTAPLMPVLPVLDAELVSVDTNTESVLVPVDLDALYPDAYAQAYNAEFDAWMHRSLLRRMVDDPYWILLTIAGTLGISIIGVTVYGIVTIITTISEWFSLYGADVGKGVFAVLCLLLVCLVCAGGKAIACVCGCCGK